MIILNEFNVNVNIKIISYRLLIIVNKFRIKYELFKFEMHLAPRERGTAIQGHVYRDPTLFYHDTF